MSIISKKVTSTRRDTDVSPLGINPLAHKKHRSVPARFMVRPVADSYYTFDRIIFSILVLTVIALTLLYVLKFGFDTNMYLRCPDNGQPCQNPIYKQDCYNLKDNIGRKIQIDPNLCNVETFPAGFVYGTPPTSYYDELPVLFLILLLLSFGINHLVWNMGGDRTMVIKILITPKTEAGTEAINKHFREQGMKEKMFLKASKVKQEQLKDGSLLLRIPSFNNLSLSDATWRQFALDIMKSNGAEIDTDYTLMVTQE